MNNKHSFSRNILIHMLVLTTISIGVIGALWTWQQYQSYQRDSETLREVMLKSHKELLKSQVQKSVDYIEYNKSLTEKRLRASIAEKINDVYRIANSLYEKWADYKTAAEIQDLIRETLRAIRFNAGRGYIFILDMNGKVQLQSDRPEFEGIDMLKTQSRPEVDVVKSMINLAKQQGEGFYQYNWTRPGRFDKKFPKIAFIKLFKPYNWIIGTGEYLDDFESTIKADVLDYLGSIKFGKDGYIFATQWDGLDLTGPAKGKNMLGATDVNGVKIVQELIKLAKGEGGFLNYVMPKFKGKKPDPKLSYVQGIKDWQWYVGAGIYIDDIETAIEKKRIEMKKEILKSLTQIFAALFGLFFFAWFFAWRSSYKARVSFDKFFSFFDKGAREAAVIDPEKMTYKEFEELACSANDMIEARTAAQTALMESEKKHRLIVENMNDLIIKLDPDKNLVFASPSYCRLFAQKLGDILNKPFLTFLLQEERNPFEISLDALRQYPHTSYHEAHALTDSGYKWIAWSNRAVFDSGGKIHEYILVGRDITEKKQAEDASKENQEWLQNILDSIQAGVIVIDPESHEILELNLAACEMIGVGKEKIVNHVCHNYICPNDVGKCPVTDFGMKVDNSDRELLKADGTVIPIMKTVNFAAINGKNYLIESFLDLREKKKLESMLLQSQKMEAIGTLAGGIAHDFNNILSAMMGYTELSQSYASSGENISDYLTKIMKACNRAKDLVLQILTFSRQADYTLSPLSVKRIANEVLKLIRPSLPSTIEIQTNFKSDGLVLGDATQLHQIFMNLCTNAGQAMQKQGGNLEISITDEKLNQAFALKHPEIEPGDYVKICVSDTGRGISDADLARIFDPFFTTKDKGEGTGLGLAVVHGIVKQNKGIITVSSEEGKGTSFTIFLPATDKDAPSVDLNDKEILPQGNERILLVDDEKALIEIGRQHLKRLGYAVIAETDPAQAINLFCERPEGFDLVVTDMTMPKITGDVLVQKIRSIRNDIPVILCTGFSHEMTEDRAVEIGISKYLMKPVSGSELARTIRKILDGK